MNAAQLFGFREVETLPQEITVCGHYLKVRGHDDATVKVYYSEVGVTLAIEGKSAEIMDLICRFFFATWAEFREGTVSLRANRDDGFADEAIVAAARNILDDSLAAA